MKTSKTGLVLRGQNYQIIGKSKHFRTKYDFIEKWLKMKDQT